jgi:hypothetical protein
MKKYVFFILLIFFNFVSAEQAPFIRFFKEGAVGLVLLPSGVFGLYKLPEIVGEQTGKKSFKEVVVEHKKEAVFVSLVTLVGVGFLTHAIKGFFHC